MNICTVRTIERRRELATQQIDLLQFLNDHEVNDDD